MLIGLLAIFGLYFGLLGLLIGMSRGRPLLMRALLVGLFAAGVEWLRGDAWYLRFPWYTVPHALAQSPAWIAPVRWLGVYGFTIAVWSIAALGAFGRPWAWLAFSLIPASSLLLADFDAPDRQAILFQTENPGGVEGLIPSVAPDEPIHLAVMPEYTYQVPYQRPLTNPNGPAALARKLGSPVVFGAIDGDPLGSFQNVAVVLAPDGNVIGLFPKQRPVPLFRDGRPGTTRPVFPVDQGTLGIAICYDYDAPEVAGSIVRSGATVLLAPNYDSMQWGAMQHVHHALLFRLRAVENDRWIIRASSSGRSEVIDPHGRASEQGIEIGETSTVVLGYGHRTTQPLGQPGLSARPDGGAGDAGLCKLVGLESAARSDGGRRDA